MGIVACYDAHLYCDCDNDAHAFNEFPHEFAGDTKQAAFAEAKGRGWKIMCRKGWTYAICPKCSRAGIRPAGNEPRYCDAVPEKHVVEADKGEGSRDGI